MSGGVGPSGDILLPKEEEEIEQKVIEDHSASFSKKDHHHHHHNQNQKPRKAYFSFSQLNALAVIIVLSASGMVSIEDFTFVVFSLIYMYFISKVAFPTHSTSTDPPVFGHKNKLLGIYVIAGALIGIFLPIAYIFEGILEGDQEGIKAAAPHLFLLASQVFMEGLSFSDRFSLPIRVYVPVVYNTVRIFTIMEWLRSEISKVDQENSGSSRRMYVGRGLAIANMAFWCFNLFGFLLPFYLPKAFKIYYSSSASSSKVKD